MYNFIARKIGEVLKDAYNVSTEVTLTFPADALHGDLTTNVCLTVGKTIGVSPQEIATTLLPVLSGIEDIEKVEVAGPGFLNITLTIAARLKQLLRVQAACEPLKTREEPPVIVEYSSPNIAKPLGVHHILSTVIGQVITNLYRHLGYTVITVNHLGDWGTHFGNLFTAYERWGTKPVEECTVDDLLHLYVRFHEEAENDASLEDEGRKAFRKLEQGEEGPRTFWKAVVELSLKEIKATYERLHVAIDHDHGESFYEDKMMPVLEEGRRKGVFREGEKGALIAEFPSETKLPPAIVLKADGSTIYHTRDLAVIRYRMDTWHPQASLYVVDTAQELYFKQLFAMVKQLGWDLPHLEHIIFGRMSFPEKKMSTRKGNIIRLEDALDEAVRRADALIAGKESHLQGKERADLADTVGIGALVYGVLSQNRRQNIVFTWERSLTFDGNSGPYLQYTYARARSVLRKAALEKVDPPSSIDALETQELLLMRQMAKFPGVLEEARAEAMPHKLTNYLYALCQAYNTFYNALPILQSHEPLRTLRLALSQLTADILKTGAQILTLRVPERM